MISLLLTFIFSIALEGIDDYAKFFVYGYDQFLKTDHIYYLQYAIYIAKPIYACKVHRV